MRPSVRWHLLLAFLGISSFAVLGGGVAIYAFLKIEDVLERITERAVPTALTSLRLSRRAERLVAAAPALLAAATSEEQLGHAARISAEIDELDGALDELKTARIDPGLIREIDSAVDWLTLNLISLETTVVNGLAVGQQRRALVRDALATAATMSERLRPYLDQSDETIATVHEASRYHSRSEGPDRETTLPAPWTEARLVSELDLLGNLLRSVGAIEDQSALSALGDQLTSSFSRIETWIHDTDTALQDGLSDDLAEIRGFLEGQQNVLKARLLELEATSNGRRLLVESRKASEQLTSALERLVDGAEADVQDAVLRADYEQQRSTVALVIVIALSLVTSSLIVWLYVGRSLIRRLTTLSNSMLAISGGDLSAAIPTGGRDELGRMAEALTVFRATTRERAAAERARANLSRYFSPNLADHLSRHPDTLDLRGERRELSFLCTDLADFTPLVERLDPTVVVALMNDYLGGIARLVFDHGGTVDTVVGDAVHAIFGAPLPQPDHPARAVACALAIDQFTRDLAASLCQRDVALGLTRIGVHTGTATVGDFGGEAYFHYTALGDAVNTAARLQDANKDLGTRVCVSADTVASVPNFLGRPVGNLRVKGKASVIRAFEPLTEDGALSLPAYLEAFGKLEGGAPDCLQSFANYVATYGADPLASFHLRRLLTGEVGATIHLDAQ